MRIGDPTPLCDVSGSRVIAHVVRPRRAGFRWKLPVVSLIPTWWPTRAIAAADANTRGGEPARAVENSFIPAVRAQARGPMARRPSAAMRRARRWSPGIVPPLLGGLLLLIAVVLAATHVPQPQPLVTSSVLLALLVAYLVTGIVYGLLLYFSASDVVWVWLVALSVPVYVLLTLAILWGLIVFVPALLVCLGLLTWYVRESIFSVPEGKVAVTAILGGYARTLMSGRTILAPGERVAATLDAGEHQYVCPTHRTDIPNELGEIYQARASATVSYRLIAAEARNAIVGSADWEHDLHTQIGSSLTQALGEWGAHLLMGDGTPPDQLLAKIFLRELRDQARPHGIHIAWVSVRDIWLAPASELLPAAGPPGTPPITAGVPFAGTATAVAARPMPAPAALRERGEGNGHGAPPQNAPAQAKPEEPAEPAEPANALSPDVLANAYEAVRAGQITDPDTVRQIANAFLKVAADEEQSAAFPYDAAAAAHILLDRAKALEHGGH